MSVFRTSRKATLALILLAVGAAGAGCSANCIRSDEELIISVDHSSSGPAPIITRVELSAGGILRWIGPSGRETCGAVEERSLRELSNILTSSAFAEALLEESKRSDGFFDYESVLISSKDLKGEVVIEGAGAAASEFLDRLATVVMKSVGKPAPWLEGR